ncbi:hypothetical protein O6H91_19G005800 [Diphasiastrum complanatum]|uniref:Uncharacterized protein n=1 Tax=Diphasiastrum complanatum TaxID=34168 RepID=A0ACC2ASF0_DIPCM|nr:hypothetical protein O6H91_19G005800 [Diphasiastrum complanatum]
MLPGVIYDCNILQMCTTRGYGKERKAAGAYDLAALKYWGLLQQLTSAAYPISQSLRRKKTPSKLPAIVSCKESPLEDRTSSTSTYEYNMLRSVKYNCNAYEANDYVVNFVGPILVLDHTCTCLTTYYFPLEILLIRKPTHCDVMMENGNALCNYYLSYKILM